MKRPAPGRVLITLLALAAAGCGSTVTAGTAVQGAGAQAPGEMSALTPAGVRTAPAGPAPAAPQDSNPAAAVANTVRLSVPAGGSGGSTSVTVQNGVPEGTGVTPTSIYVGIGYATNSSAADAALGAKDISQGDPRADAQTIVDDINAHGGASGRRLIPVWHATDATSTDPWAAEDQQACTDYTQDHHVFAVMGTGLTDTFNACLSKVRAVEIDSGTIIGPDQGFFSQYPDYYDVGTISQDRMMAQLPRSLQALHYFGGWDAVLGRATQAPAKIGVLSVDTPEWNRPLDRLLLPALRADGHAVPAPDVIRIGNPSSTSGDGQVIAAIQAAELRFRQDGVSHVILLDTAGNLLFIFSRYAQSQHYYPRYGVGSGSGAQTLYTSGNVDAQQLNGLLGFSWNPVVDLPPTTALRYRTAAGKACISTIEGRTGQNFSTDANAMAVALADCDELYLLRDAIDKAGPSITPDTVHAAIEALRGAYQPSELPEAYFGPGRHDAGQQGWNMGWDAGCTCVRYVGPAFPIPSV